MQIDWFVSELLAWMGKATNTAAKLSNVGSGARNIYITGFAYDRLHDWAKPIVGQR